MSLIKKHFQKSKAKKTFKTLKDNEYFEFDEAYKIVKSNFRSNMPLEQARRIQLLKK